MVNGSKMDCTCRRVLGPHMLELLQELYQEFACGGKSRDLDDLEDLGDKRPVVDTPKPKKKRR